MVAAPPFRVVGHGWDTRPRRAERAVLSFGQARIGRIVGWGG